MCQEELPLGLLQIFHRNVLSWLFRKTLGWHPERVTPSSNSPKSCFVSSGKCEFFAICPTLSLWWKLKYYVPESLIRVLQNDVVTLAGHISKFSPHHGLLKHFIEAFAWTRSSLCCNGSETISNRYWKDQVCFRPELSPLYLRCNL